MADQSTVDMDYQAYCTILDLWKQENPIKTTKLQVLLAVNGALITVVSVSGGFRLHNWPLYVVGVVLSGIWTLSIGRTLLYQQSWKQKLAAFAAKYPADPRFSTLDVSEAMSKQKRWLRIIGGVSTRYYIPGAPIFFALCWLTILVWVLVSGA